MTGPPRQRYKKVLARRLPAPWRAMAGVERQPGPHAMEQTCWRGLAIGHPREWEPSRLSGPGEAHEAVFVDRRYERLHVYWNDVPRPPDLERMYEKLRQAPSERPGRPLTGQAGWHGIVRPEAEGVIVHAGRYFPDAAVLVQAIVTFPGSADPAVQAAVLGSIRPQDDGDETLWQALGLSVRLDKTLELAEATSKVGRVTWRFRRAARPRRELLVERLAMVDVWLKVPLERWLRSQVPSEFALGPQDQRTWQGHPTATVVSRRRGAAARLIGRSVWRIDHAWICPLQRRLYRVACFGRSRGPVELVPGTVQCCRPVRLPADVPEVR